MRKEILTILLIFLKKSKLNRLKSLHLLADYIYNAIPKQKFIIVNNQKICIHKSNDAVSKWLYIYNQWEPFETQIIQKLVKNGDTVVDLGAHIGYYTALASELVGKNGEVYSFEPEPKNFMLLKKMCKNK
jgi:protein-L-isoaspartate O-methyltransferase